jgi:hypothetical protein
MRHDHASGSGLANDFVNQLIASKNRFLYHKTTLCVHAYAVLLDVLANQCMLPRADK